MNFAPDKNLGAYVNKVTGRNMLLWNGACMVHEVFSLEKINKLKFRNPQALLLAHPECEEAILNPKGAEAFPKAICCCKA